MEDQMRAVSEAFNDEMRQSREFALALGRATAFSASQAAEGISRLVEAGKRAEEAFNEAVTKVREVSAKEDLVANAGTLEVHINVKGGSLPPITKAFGIMSAALAAYGHEFTAEDQAVIGEAAELLTDPDVECLPAPSTTHEGCQHARDHHPPPQND